MGNVGAAVVLAAAAVLSSAAPASAATEVSGQHDAAPPLVIEPAPASNPITLTRTQFVGETMMFIQNMPVTKKIRTVTLGDLAYADGCTAPGRYAVVIREHTTPDPDSLSSPVVSSDIKPLPGTLGKVTWSLSSPTLLSKGKTYSIRLSWGADCRDVKVRSWDHNLTTINSGPTNTCIAAPLMYYEDGTRVRLNAKRMWHTTGVQDSAGCLTTLSFDPGIHGGWVLVHSTNGSDWVVAADKHPYWPAPGHTHQQCSDNALYSNAGLVELWWREIADGTEVTCNWTQYRPPVARRLVLQHPLDSRLHGGRPAANDVPQARHDRLRSASREVSTPSAVSPAGDVPQPLGRQHD